MKKYLVIGNPIEHSLSPKLHNYWIKENKIKAVYDKKLLNEEDIEETISEIASPLVIIFFGILEYNQLFGGMLVMGIDM